MYMAAFGVIDKKLLDKPDVALIRDLAALSTMNSKAVAQAAILHMAESRSGDLSALPALHLALENAQHVTLPEDTCLLLNDTKVIAFQKHSP